MDEDSEPEDIPRARRASKKEVMAGVNILQVMEEFGIEAEPISSGNFNYRCKCPSSGHKGGVERTGSCYVDSEGNNFWCFGCGAGTNVIDFHMICSDLDFSGSMDELRKRVKVDPNRKSAESYFVVEANNYALMLQISGLFRRAMKSQPGDLKWINSLMMYSESFLRNLKPAEYDKTLKLKNKIKKIIDDRHADMEDE